jgi:hypothetical protein
LWDGYQVYVNTAGTWEQSSHIRVQETASALLQQYANNSSKWHQLSDFDNHLEDPNHDWLNSNLFQKIK